MFRSKTQENRGHQMSNAENRKIIELQLAELIRCHTDLEMKRNDDDSFLISGDVNFNAVHNNVTIKDKFTLEILIPNDYPARLPTVKETGGRIPREKDYHANPDGSLCLNIPIELRKVLNENGTLLDFVNKSVIDFLYAFSFKEKYGYMPYGEWSHGGKGIIEYYSAVFKVDNSVSVVGLLRTLADHDFRRQMLCPCGNKKKLRKCHGGQLKDLINIQTPDQFMYEYKHALKYVLDEKMKIPREFISGALMEELERSQNDS